ncbi:MAG: 50S ribosomal protein L6 [Desulfurococcus sp.]|nr:50S ribosomal protein L6 [Desulfurococcus sp.]
MAKMLYVAEKVRIPEGIAVEVDGLKVTVRGPKGFITRDFSHARGVIVRLEDDSVVVEAYRADRKLKALVGSIAAHIRNMITGVMRGYRYKLKIIYSHFPMSVTVDEKNRVVRIKNFMGERSDRIARIYGNVKVSVKGDEVIVEGVDIEEVGLTAASIERATKVTDRDRRIFMDGIYIYEKGEAS